MLDTYYHFQQQQKPNPLHPHGNSASPYNTLSNSSSNANNTTQHIPYKSLSKYMIYYQFHHSTTKTTSLTPLQDSANPKTIREIGHFISNHSIHAYTLMKCQENTCLLLNLS